MSFYRFIKMKNLRFIIFILTFFCFIYIAAQEVGNYPDVVKKLIKAYPKSVKSYDGQHIILSDNSKIYYVIGKNKTHEELMKSTNLDDIFYYEYIKGKVSSIPKDYDPGRIRNEQLLKKMYGSNSQEVQKHLATIVWCPSLVNQKLQVTSVNGVDKQLQKISDELDNHSELRDYLRSSGTFNWRKVRGTDRLSSHSFGTAIDLNVKYSDYWQWDCKCTSEDVNLTYKNRIPQMIVDIFEKHGFIWGGKWYHYDTMHFEYRPELLIED